MLVMQSRHVESSRTEHVTKQLNNKYSLFQPKSTSAQDVRPKGYLTGGMVWNPLPCEPLWCGCAKIGVVGSQVVVTDTRNAVRQLSRLGTQV